MRTTTCLGVEMLETRCNPSLLSLTPVTPLLAPITTPVAPLTTTLAPVASLAAPAAQITSLVSATTSTSLTQLTSTVTQTTAGVTSLIQSTPLGTVTSLLQQVTAIVPETMLSLDDVSVNLLSTSLNLGSIGVTLGGQGLVDISLGDTAVQVGNLLGLDVNSLGASVTGNGVNVVSDGAGAALGGSSSSIGGGGANLPLGGGLDNLMQQVGENLAYLDAGWRLGNVLPVSQGLAPGAPAMQAFDIANAGTRKTSGSGAEESADLAQTSAALVREGESVDSIFGLHSFDDAELSVSRVAFVPGQDAMVPAGVGATANDGINLSVKEADLLEQMSLVQQIGVDSALQQLLTCLERLAAELALVLSEAGLLPWLLALLAAGAAVEIVRRDRQSAQNEQAAVPGVV